MSLFPKSDYSDDPTKDYKVHSENPENRELDVLVSNGQTLTRAQVRAMHHADAKHAPATGQKRLQELEAMAKGGRLPNELYAKLRKDVMNGGTGTFTAAELEAAKRDTQERKEANRWIESHDNIVDLAEGIENSFANGTLRNRNITKSIDDAVMRFLGETERAGIPSTDPRVVQMVEYAKDLKFRAAQMLQRSGRR